ncbi:unnamed protein product [Caenorhabditis auriculariae]|uniref:Uncharacterized protein n=1 Tax=Caenorhabditis auriculariae TaxID=2777116 RepID=A0A8S1HTS2_9PELO|nr:unnamed protein product [Caenorhabditis auriculariae]
MAEVRVDWNTHVHLASDCMERYRAGLDALCDLEQDLSIGYDSKGNRLKEPINRVIPFLTDPRISLDNRLRLILLYALFENGISSESMVKLLAHAEIPFHDRSIFTNAARLGVDLVVEEGRPRFSLPPRRPRTQESAYTSARWVPRIKDLMEDAIHENLSLDHFPYVVQRDPVSERTIARSARFGSLERSASREAPKTEVLPRLIVFVVGGMSHSEMRSAYEVMAANSWDVIIGAEQIITPTKFLDNLRSLSEPFEPAVNPVGLNSYPFKRAESLEPLV